MKNIGVFPFHFNMYNSLNKITRKFDCKNMYNSLNIYKSDIFLVRIISFVSLKRQKAPLPTIRKCYL